MIWLPNSHTIKPQNLVFMTRILKQLWYLKVRVFRLSGWCSALVSNHVTLRSAASTRGWWVCLLSLGFLASPVILPSHAMMSFVRFKPVRLPDTGLWTLTTVNWNKLPSFIRRSYLVFAIITIKTTFCYISFILVALHNCIVLQERSFGK